MSFLIKFIIKPVLIEISYSNVLGPGNSISGLGGILLMVSVLSVLLSKTGDDFFFFFFFECKSGATVFRKHEIRSPGYLTDCSHEHRGNQQYTKVGVRTDSVLGGKRCLAPEEGQHCERDSQTWKETVRGNRSIQGAKRQGLNHKQKAKTASSAHAIEVPYKFRQHRQSPFGSF